MNNDLISREALNWKEGATLANNEESIIRADATLALLSEVKLTIDNAQTVELQMGRMTNGVIIPIERPAGEWIFLKADETQTDGYMCSNCKKTFHTRVPYFSEFSFCPICGADMRGEE